MLQTFIRKNYRFCVSFCLIIISSQTLFVSAYLGELSIIRSSDQSKQDTESMVLEEKSKKVYLTTVSARPDSKISAGEVSKSEESGKVASSVNNRNLGVVLGFALEPLTTSKISSLEQQIGRKFDILMGYVQWGNPLNDKFNFSVYTSSGKVPLISWEPWDPRVGANQPTYKLTNISSGKFDNYIREQAKTVKEFNKPIFIRFAHEMNGNWYPWGGTVNGNKVADYVSAWRHIHALFAQEGVKNVTWVWSPDATSYPNIKGNDLSDYYPGSSFVDWVGLDGYNWGSSRAGKTWETFSQIFSKAYKKVTGYNKPIMIAETASTESGGDKSSWLTNTLTRDIPTLFPQIKALIYFNINKETNWDLNSSQKSISQFREAVKNAIYDVSLKIQGSKLAPP